MKTFHHHTIALISLLVCWGVPASGQDRSRGLVFSSEEDYRSVPLATTAMMGNLPPSKDLTQWFPSPGDQGQQGSCVGWAVAYGLKSFQESIERRKRNPASWRFSPSFLYNQVKIADCEGGANIELALKFLRTEGCAPLDDFPYNSFSCHEIPGGDVKDKAKLYLIADYRRVNIQNQAEVKSQINSFFPVVIGMMVDQAFERLGPGQIYDQGGGSERGGHAMIVIGYDDTRGNGAYKVLNSWGSQWGDNGYGWISYDMFQQRVKEAFTAQDVVVNDPDADPADQPDPNPPGPGRNDVIPQPLVNADVSASLGPPQVIHNQPIQTPNGLFPGMLINVPGNIVNGRGASAQLLVRFYFPNGAPLLANQREPFFRDINGLATVGTPMMPVVNDPANTQLITLGIPYYALNFQPTGGQALHNVQAVATIYINQFEKANSAPAPMQILY